MTWRVRVGHGQPPGNNEDSLNRTLHLSPQLNFCGIIGATSISALIMLKLSIPNRDGLHCDDEEEYLPARPLSYSRFASRASNPSDMRKRVASRYTHILVLKDDTLCFYLI